MPSTSLQGFLALSLLPGVGPRLVRQALNRFHDPWEIAFRLSPAGWRSLRGVGAATAEGIVRARPELRRQVDRELLFCRDRGVRILPLDDADYPAQLLEIDDPPTVLFVRGSLPPAKVRMAVVGSRRATHYGRRVAAGLAGGLAERGAVIVSGGARGIDACAHRGALEVSGSTVAVLGSGLGRPYPREHDSLYEEMCADGAVITEFPSETSPQAENFPRRNRLIAGLSVAVIVVEAALRSGSLITARHALEQGREVLAVPGPVTSEQSAGCHGLIRDGARLVQWVDDVVDELSPFYRSRLKSPPPRPADPEEDRAMTAEEVAIVALLDDTEPLHVDDLAERVSFGVARLQAALSTLQLSGSVEVLPGGYYLSRPRKRP